MTTLAKKKPRKMGRTRLPFDWDLFDGLCARKMDASDCADLMNISVDTIENRIKEKYPGMTFSEYQNKKMSTTRHKLKNKLLSMAESGNVACLIFALKNWCGMTDKVEEITKESLKPFIIEYLDGRREEMGVRTIEPKGDS